MNISRLLLVAGALSVAVVFMPLSAPAQAAPFCLGKPATIVGTSGSDTIHGTNYSDVIASLGGGDYVHALGGNDLVCGGDGNDVIFDGYGSDDIDGGNGFDTVYLCPDLSVDHLVNIEKVVNSSVGCT